MTLRKTDDPRTLLRQIPQVDALLKRAEFERLGEVYSNPELTSTVRAILDELRQRALGGGELRAADLEPDAIHAAVNARLAVRNRPSYRAVINATGVILHTGLGRAPLPRDAVEALAATGERAQRLEIDLETGQRGGRDAGCVELICELTGCEAATVVNNNAAATVLILGALARGKRVLVSRGELVEIGGSYRIPDIMSESGAVLAEIGTTNRTHLRDYARAIDDEAGMILKVHTSNYRVVGFTHEVGLKDLSGLAQRHELPLVHDMGSGCLVDLESRGFPHEPSVQRSLADGADLVCFSGDKLLGGPQAGILAGRADLVERCRRHPLYRAMRPGRLIYTALEATLRLYRRGDDEALRRIPTLHRLIADEASLRARAEALLQAIEARGAIGAEVVPCASQAGSGSLPAQDFISWGVRVETAHRLDTVARELRIGEPAILPRIHEGALLFDARTLDDDQLGPMAERLVAILSDEGRC